jgi:ribonuclease P protein component
VLFHTENISLKTKITPNHRVNIVVSKSIFPKAVDRNLLKRRVANIVSNHLKEIPQNKNNKTLFFYFKKNIKNKKHNEIKKEILILLDLLKKSKI